MPIPHRHLTRLLALLLAQLVRGRPLRIVHILPHFRHDVLQHHPVEYRTILLLLLLQLLHLSNFGHCLPRGGGRVDFVPDVGVGVVGRTVTHERDRAGRGWRGRGPPSPRSGDNVVVCPEASKAVAIVHAGRGSEGWGLAEVSPEGGCAWRIIKDAVIAGWESRSERVGENGEEGKEKREGQES